jgi:hypothetical protein
MQRLSSIIRRTPSRTCLFALTHLFHARTTNPPSMNFFTWFDTRRPFILLALLHIE